MKTEAKCENCELKRFMVLDPAREVKRPVCLPKGLAQIKEHSGQEPEPVDVCDTQHFKDKGSF